MLLECLFFALPVSAGTYRIQRPGIENGLSNNFIMGIAQDQQGYIWVSTESGLNRFEGKKFRTFKKGNPTLSRSISGNELNRLYADKFNNQIWIAPQRSGLDVFDCATESFSHKTREQETD